MSKWTKGPWSLSKYSSVLDANGVAFASFTTSPKRDAEMAARANLIVNAPELVEALKIIEQHLAYSRFDSAHEVARAILAKVEG